jgi:poly(A) polymerase
MDKHKEALFIIEKLNRAGYIAYYAGGWVRDLLLKKVSDDIDIATSAPPEIVQGLFEHTVPIGLAFGIILVIINDKKYEVATFRKDINYKDGRRPESVEYTTPFQDAIRRDFTINGMFYDPLKDEILDFIEGQKDLSKKIIKAIGNPHERISEDRLRMIRAIRLATRFDFIIEEETKKAILAHSNELFPSVAIERVYQEIQKMANYSKLKDSLLKLFDYDLLDKIFPQLKSISRNSLEQKLQFTDLIPYKYPLITKLLELFPKFSKDQIEDLCNYLKLSNKDMNLALHLFETRKLLKTTLDNFTLANLYANSHTEMCLHIINIHNPKDEQKAFLKDHEVNKKKLHKAILRIKHKKPLITSKTLIDMGINPGPKLGEILRTAEKIAINEEIYSPEKVIEKLKEKKLL